LERSISLQVRGYEAYPRRHGNVEAHLSPLVNPDEILREPTARTGKTIACTQASRRSQQRACTRSPGGEEEENDRRRGGVKREVGKKGKRHRCAKLMDEGIPPRPRGEQSEERDPLLRGCRRKSKRSGKTDRGRFARQPISRQNSLGASFGVAYTPPPWIAARSQRGAPPPPPPPPSSALYGADIREEPNRSALSPRKKRGACISPRFPVPRLRSRERSLRIRIRDPIRSRARGNDALTISLRIRAAT